MNLDLETPERALAIGAHPDDIEFGCGATLAKWAAAARTLAAIRLASSARRPAGNVPARRTLASEKAFTGTRTAAPATGEILRG